MKVLTIAMGTEAVPFIPFQEGLWALCTVSRAVGPEGGGGAEGGE